MDAQARKAYDLTLTFKSLATQESLGGLIVFFSIKGETIDTAYTDTEGKVCFEAVEAKHIKVEAKDPEGKYRNRLLDLYAEKKQKTMDQTYYLRYGEEEEEKFFAEREEKCRRARETDSISNPQDSVTCAFLDQEANFPGGVAHLQQYIQRGIDYPEEAIEFGEQGRVYMLFIVEKDGCLSNVTVERGVSRNLDAEAVRIIRYRPNWEPGICDGKLVRTRCRLPVIFKLE